MNSEITGKQVKMRVGSVTVEGTLVMPQDAEGLVLFAHGSGSGRHSPRNRYVAAILQQAKLGTLLFDLLTPQEESVDNQTRELRFNIGFLAERLLGATNWATQNVNLKDRKIGYFGASTGAAAALVAASRRPDLTAAVVSRGGRPDLAGPALRYVRAPTLLIVGGNDTPVITLNEKALLTMQTEKRLEIVPGATHLFEEPGTLAQAAWLACTWFKQHFAVEMESSAAQR